MLTQIYVIVRPQRVNSLRPRLNRCPFAHDIFKCIFLNENVWIPIKISLKFVPMGPINNIPAMVQIMAWRRPGNKPLSEPMMVVLPTHICVTRPQWVNPIFRWVVWDSNSIIGYQHSSFSKGHQGDLPYQKSFHLFASNIYHSQNATSTNNTIFFEQYSVVTWPAWHLKSPAYPLFAQASNKEYINLYIAGNNCICLFGYIIIYSIVYKSHL